MTERERATRSRHPSSDPSTNVPLNGPDVEPEDKLRQLMGDRAPEDQSAIFDADDVNDLGELTSTGVYEAELAAGVDDDLPGNDDDNLELLTELELREGETEDPMEAVEEGMAYIPPTDPPTVPGGGYTAAEVASGLSLTAREEPYDADHHGDFLPADDEISARVREALRADASTAHFAHRIRVETRGGVVVLRGLVDDLDDGDNALAVAEYAAGVVEVVDELRVRALGGESV
ncbi:MAG TPA: BON domain-containing protein [Roseiflexaceae bacterium]|nr:BON domain-containing protein [Roseiflexaceae bacterium]